MSFIEELIQKSVEMFPKAKEAREAERKIHEEKLKNSLDEAFTAIVGEDSEEGLNGLKSRIIDNIDSNTLFNRCALSYIYTLKKSDDLKFGDFYLLDLLYREHNLRPRIGNHLRSKSIGDFVVGFQHIPKTEDTYGIFVSWKHHLPRNYPPKEASRRNSSQSSGSQGSNDSNNSENNRNNRRRGNRVGNGRQKFRQRNRRY